MSRGPSQTQLQVLENLARLRPASHGLRPGTMNAGIGSTLVALHRRGLTFYDNLVNEWHATKDGRALLKTYGVEL